MQLNDMNHRNNVHSTHSVAVDIRDFVIYKL